MLKPQGMLSKKKLVTMEMRAAMAGGEQHLLEERPVPNVSVITINRADVGNTLTHRTRAQLFNLLQMNDQDPDVRVSIIRGAGGNFSQGNDFDSQGPEDVLPFFESEMDGQTSRHVLNGWLMINDLAKPVVAMVEGDAIGGGLELAAACDVCICADNANIGYGQVRGQGLADYQVLPWMCGMRNAMELMLTNGTMTGIEAERRNFATMCVPQAELESKTMDLAQRIAKIPADLLAFNKKSVHRAFEAQGMRTNLRNSVDLEQLMFKTPGAKSLITRRGQQKGKPAAQRVPPPRPVVGATSKAAVATQVVSAKTAPPAPKPAAAAPLSAAAPKPMVAPVAAAPKPVSVPVKVAPKPVAAPVKAAPKPVVAKTATQSLFDDDVSEDSLDVPVAPKPVAAAPKAAAPKPAAAAPKAAAPKPAAAAPKAAAPTPAAAAPKAAAPKSAAAAPKAAAPTPAAAAPKAVAPKAVAAPKPAAAAVAKPAAEAPALVDVKKAEGGVHVYVKEGVHFHFGKSKL